MSSNHCPHGNLLPSSQCAFCHETESLRSRISELEAALITANQLINEVKISSSEARRAGAEAALYWSWRRLAPLHPSWLYEKHIQRGLSAVCGEEE